MYQAQITRAHKGAILLLLDQSGSMADEIIFEGRTTTKAEALCNAVNGLLEELISRCRRERFVGNYFDVGIIGYSASEAKYLLGKGFVNIVDIEAMDTPTKGRIISRTLPNGESFQAAIEQRVWVRPEAQGRTPMGAALRMALRACSSWCKRNPESFPPVVINISDGEATDLSHDELIALADNIKAQATKDGNTLLVNIHLASEEGDLPLRIYFPSESANPIRNRHLRLLYNISSTLPSIYNESIMELGGSRPPFRAICHNAAINELMGLLSIGTVSADMII